MIKIKWLIVKNDDIADPYILVRSSKRPQEILYQKTVPYIQRSLEISVSELQAKIPRAGSGASNTNDNSTGNAQDDYEVCVLARDSRTAVRSLNKQQCRALPNIVTSSGSQLSQRYYSVIIVVVINVFLTLFNYRC